MARPFEDTMAELADDGITLSDVERGMCIAALNKYQCQREAAEALGIKRDALRRRCVKHGIKKSDWRWTS